MKRGFAAFTVVLLMASGCQSHAESQLSTAKPMYGAWGVDLTNMDRAIRPGDDFFDFVVGGWTKKAEIRPDESYAGTYLEVSDRTDAELQTVIEEAAAAHNSRGDVSQKVGDFYSSFIDEAVLEAKGVDPIRPDLAAVDAATDKEALVPALGVLNRAGAQTPFPTHVTVDPNRPDRHVAQLWQGGLSFPNRDYYLNKDEEFVDLRGDFLAHVERLLSLAGYADAEAQAAQLLALETKLAQAHWPLDDENDPQKTKTIMSRAELEQLAVGAPLDAIFDELTLPRDATFQVGMPEVTAKTATLFNTEPLETWQTYVRYQLLANFAPYLSKPFDDEVFNFYSRTIQGAEEQRPRSTRGLILVSSNIGDALGQLYVATAFPAQSRQRVLDLVETFRTAYASRIDAADWMGQETRHEAQLKLAAMLPKVGYPNVWDSYDTVDVSADDLIGNIKSAHTWEWNDALTKLGRPVDRTEWDTTPQTLNAYYDFTLNDLSFPAAVLQPPNFDPAADPAVIYGSLAGCSYMGHEMSHGFDDAGRKFDATGALRDWWTQADADRYQREADKLVAQFDTYEPLPGMHVDGQLTLGENIADLAGLQVAYDAYRSSLDGSEPPVLDGFTGDQRFFLAYAACYREIQRDEYVRDGLLSDEHSPPKFRVNGIVRNMDAWYKAFDVKEGDELYLPPEQRVHLW